MSLVINNMARPWARIGPYCSYIFLSLSPANRKEKISASGSVMVNTDDTNSLLLNKTMLFKKQKQKQGRKEGNHTLPLRNSQQIGHLFLTQE